MLDNASDVRPHETLDWEKLESYLRRELPETEGRFSVAQFKGGHANLTYELRFGERAYVLRRPPFGKIAPGAHDMRREFRVLSSLWEDFLPAARPYLLCTDHDVIGADFVVVERRYGTVVRYALPQEFAGIEAVERRLTDALLRCLAELHALDVSAPPRAELGRPKNFLERQLGGWKKRWALVDDGNPDMREAAEKLSKNVPTTQRNAVVHGDYKFDNCQFQPGEPDRVTSVFDWDMATLGDPVFDFACLLAYWPDPELDAAEMPIPLLVGDWPAKDYLRTRYAEYSGLDLDELAWYEALAAYKTATIARQLYARYRAGDSHDARMEKFGSATKMFARLANR